MKVRVTDSVGTVWKKVRKNDRRHVWTAVAPHAGTTGVVTILMKRSDGRVFRRASVYTVRRGTAPHTRRRHPHRHERAGRPLGRAGQRRRRGLAARRIFADLAGGQRARSRLVEDGPRGRHDAGHLLQGGR